jgi:hypothetical protein
MPMLSLLFLGDADRREFRQSRDRLTALGRVRRAGGVEEAATILADAAPPIDVIVVAQARPGEFSHEDVQRLRQIVPLARIVALLGSWCEGESRSGKPWPGVVRTYWHQWPVRAERELRRMAAGECSAWALPPTATDEERLLADAERPLPDRRGLIAVFSRDRAMAETLATACRSWGWEAAPLRSPGDAAAGAIAVLFDCGRCLDEELVELQRTAAALAPAPLIAIVHFPRIEDCDRARQADAAAVLAKPLQWEDLFAALDRLA